MMALAATGCSDNKEAGKSSVNVAKAPVVVVAEPVSAAKQSTGTPIAKVAFVLATKPVVGKLSDVRIDLSAAAAVPDLQLQFESASVAVAQETSTATVSIVVGKSTSHVLKFTPRQEGLGDITVHLRTSPEGAETVYAIPLLVGAAGG